MSLVLSTVVLAPKRQLIFLQEGTHAIRHFRKMLEPHKNLLMVMYSVKDDGSAIDYFPYPFIFVNFCFLLTLLFICYIKCHKVETKVFRGRRR